MSIMAEPDLNQVQHDLGQWLQAALDDPEVCKEMKLDIVNWFTATGDKDKEILELKKSLRKAKRECSSCEKLIKKLFKGMRRV